MNHRCGSPDSNNSISAFIALIALMMSGFILALFFLGLDQARAAAAYTIRDDASGGDCLSLGTWDSQMKTCTLGADIAISGEGILIADDGISLDGAGHTLTGDYAGYGIWISGRHDIEVRNLEITKFGHYGLSDHYSGIEVNYSTDVRLKNNDLTDIDAQGIYFSGSTGCLISGNRSRANNGGISLWQSTGNAIVYNIADFNYFQGIWLSESSGNEIRENLVFKNFEFGIVLDPVSHNNVIEANRILANDWLGMFVSQSDNNLIRLNAFTENGSHGLSIYGSENLVYGNNFIRNNYDGLSDNLQAFSTGGNQFDLEAPAGGNYWDDWTSPDGNGDGFVDAPYQFTSQGTTAGEQDDLPLTEPVSCGKPELSLGSAVPYWSSYADYLNRELTVAYTIGNSAGPAARSVSVVGGNSSNGVILLPVYPAPVYIGTVQTQAVSLEYKIPAEIEYFRTTTYVTARDACGSSYSYPDAYSGA